MADALSAATSNNVLIIFSNFFLRLFKIIVLQLFKVTQRLGRQKVRALLAGKYAVATAMASISKHVPRDTPERGQKIKMAVHEQHSHRVVG